MKQVTEPGFNDQKREAAPPDLAPITHDYFWRVNIGRGRREHVRAHDGQVVNEIRLTQEQIKRYSAGGSGAARPPTEQPQQRSEEMANEESVNAGRADEPERYNELTVIGEPQVIAGRSMVPVECSCGVRKNVDYSNLRRGVVKSCGHLRGGKRASGDGDGPAGRRRAAKEKGPGRRTSGRRPRKERPDVAVAQVRPEPPEVVAAATNGHVDLRSVAAIIDSIVTLASQVPAGHVEKMVAEIDRMQGALPETTLMGVDELRAAYGEHRRTAEAFLAFRRQVGGV